VSIRLAALTVAILALIAVPYAIGEHY